MAGKPTIHEKIEVCKTHMDRLINLKGEVVAIKEMRKHAAWYLKGIKGSGKYRNAINECDKREQLVDILVHLVDDVESKENLSQAAV